MRRRWESILFGVLAAAAGALATALWILLGLPLPLLPLAAALVWLGWWVFWRWVQGRMVMRLVVPAVPVDGVDDVVVMRISDYSSQMPQVTELERGRHDRAR